MRIIAGEFKKRKLQGPPDDTTTRPIPDMVKEALFNILRGHPEDGAVLDCFAGTGSIGLEALSRGAPRCVFVERDKKMAEILRANIEQCGAGDRSEVVVGDALGPGALSRCPRPVHLVFFDPPYPLVRDAASWARVREQFARAVALLDDTGFAVLRTPWPFLHSAQDDGTVEPGHGSFKRDARREHVRGTARPEPGEAVRSVAPRGTWEGEHPRVRRADRAPPPREARQRDDAGDEMEEIEIDLSTPEGRALLERLMEGGAVEVDQDGREVPAGAPGAAPDGPSRRTLTRGDLSVPGARGPETHVYAGMALHFYMKQRPAE